MSVRSDAVSNQPETPETNMTVETPAVAEIPAQSVVHEPDVLKLTHPAPSQEIYAARVADLQRYGLKLPPLEVMYAAYNDGRAAAYITERLAATRRRTPVLLANVQIDACFVFTGAVLSPLLKEQGIDSRALVYVASFLSDRPLFKQWKMWSHRHPQSRGYLTLKE